MIVITVDKADYGVHKKIVWDTLMKISDQLRGPQDPWSLLVVLCLEVLGEGPLGLLWKTETVGLTISILRLWDNSDNLIETVELRQLGAYCSVLPKLEMH